MKGQKATQASGGKGTPEKILLKELSKREMRGVAGGCHLGKPLRNCDHGYGFIEEGASGGETVILDVIMLPSHDH